MWRTTVIAVTGSVGKTTCRELLYRMLTDHAPTFKTNNNENDAHSVPRTLLRIRPWHRYAVIELAANGPDTLAPLARMVRPDIAIVTAVARTHTMNYDDIQAIAHEKAALLRHLNPRGVAILNGDDPLVCAMPTGKDQKRVLFGRGKQHDVQASDVTAVWPERLRLKIAAAQDQCVVQTQLVGEHWTNSVLAATAAAVQCGIPLTDAVAAVERVQTLSRPNAALGVAQRRDSH